MATILQINSPTSPSLLNIILKMKKTILFLGDSFTWGEGLELYCDTPRWKTERLIKNEWSQLYHKQDSNAVKFRENNRYSALVGNTLNYNIIVDKDNGGSLSSFIRLAEHSLYKPFNNIETIIIQMSCLERESYHLHNRCKCDICVRSNYSHIFPITYMILEKVFNNESLNDTETFIIKFFEKEIGYKITNSKFFLAFDEIRFKWYNTIVGDFIHNYIRLWKSNGLRNIYFIDSWDRVSSDVLSLNIPKKDMIPLIGEDNKLYYKWSQ